MHRCWPPKRQGTGAGYAGKKLTRMVFVWHIL